jgi:putative ABC transport system permease protein
VVVPGGAAAAAPAEGAPPAQHVHGLGDRPVDSRYVTDDGLAVYQGHTVALVSAETVEGWGLTSRPYGAFFRAESPITPDQRRAIERGQGFDGNESLLAWLLETGETPGPGGVFASYPSTSRSVYDPAPPVQAAGIGASLVLTLAVVATALALTAAESGDERRLLDALGAPPTLRRSVAAWQALLLPALAVALAVPIGLALSLVVVTGQTAALVPWPAVAAIAVLIPLGSGAVTWLASTPGLARRRADLARPALAD